MSQEIGPVIPPPLHFEFGVAPPAAGLARALILATVDEDGMPRIAILSPAEVSAPDPSTLIVEVRAATGTSRNLKARLVGAIWCVLDGAAYSIRGTFKAAAAAEELPDRTYERFELAVASVLRDFEAGAPLVAGPTYRVPV